MTLLIVSKRSRRGVKMHPTLLVWTRRPPKTTFSFVIRMRDPACWTTRGCIRASGPASFNGVLHFSWLSIKHTSSTRTSSVRFKFPSIFLFSHSSISMAHSHQISTCGSLRLYSHFQAMCQSSSLD